MQSENSDKEKEMEKRSCPAIWKDALLKCFQSLGPYFALTGNMIVGGAGTAAFLILFFDIAPYVDVDQTSSFGFSIGFWLLLLPTIALSAILLHAVTERKTSLGRATTFTLGMGILGVMIVAVYEPLIDGGVKELGQIQAGQEIETDGDSDRTNMRSKLVEIQAKVEGLESELTALRNSIESNPALAEVNENRKTFVRVSAQEGDAVDLKIGNTTIAIDTSTASR